MKDCKAITKVILAVKEKWDESKEEVILLVMSSTGLASTVLTEQGGMHMLLLRDMFNMYFWYLVLS